MNKNISNQRGKGTQGGNMQNQGNGEKESQSEGREAYQNRESASQMPGGAKNLNRGKENQRVESWSKQGTDRKKGIHPVEPSAEKPLKREKETHRMVSWNKNIQDQEEEIQPVKSSAGATLNIEKKTMQAKTWTRENKIEGDVLNRPSSSSQTMNSHESAFKTSKVQVNPMPGGNVEELKSTAGLGTALYVIAALFLIGWAIGFFFYDAGAAIHILLVLALVAVLIRVAQGRSD